jgi:hypothetical protein
VLIGYLVIAATLVAGIAVDWGQTQDLKSTQREVVHDTLALAQAIASGQTFLCQEIARLGREHSIKIHCLTQQQRLNQLIGRLSTH